MPTATIFHLKRNLRNYRTGEPITSEITMDMPGDVGAKAVLDFVRCDCWCGMLRLSGFDVDPRTIYLFSPVARD